MKSIRDGGLLVLALLVVLACATGLAHAQPVYDAASDFSISSNPNDPWSYGWSSSVGSQLNLHPASGNTLFAVSGLLYWRDPALPTPAEPLPVVWYNSTGSTVTIGSLSALSHTLIMHPGRNHEYSVVRWTAPTGGGVDIQASFSGRDSGGPTSTDVHVLYNGTALLDDLVTTFDAGPSFQTFRVVQSGDTIDFLVGDGTDDWFSNDSTGFAATITYTAALPAPGGLTILIGGVIVVLTTMYIRRPRAGATTLRVRT